MTQEAQAMTQPVEVVVKLSRKGATEQISRLRMKQWCDVEVIEGPPRKWGRGEKNKLLLIQGLAEAGESAVPLLIQALEDANEKVRLAAAEALKDNEKYNALANGMENKYQNVRTAVIEILSEQEKFELLTQGLDSKYDDVRRAIIDILKDYRKYALLREGLCSEYSDVRLAAVHAIEKCDYDLESMISDLQDAMHDEDPDVRQEARYVLNNLSWSMSSPGMDQDLEEALLLEDFYEGNVSAIELARRGKIDALFEAYSDVDSNHDESLIEFCRAFGHVGTRRALEKLVEILLFSASKEVRKVAIEELENFNHAAVVQTISQSLYDWESPVGAAEALEKIGDKKQTVPVLIELLQHEDADVRCAAAKSLGKIDDGQAVDALKKLKEDPVEQVRKTAQRALRNIKARQTKNHPPHQHQSNNEQQNDKTNGAQ